MTECVDAFPLNEKIHIIRPHREKNTKNAYLDTTDKEELIKDRKGGYTQRENEEHNC